MKKSSQFGRLLIVICLVLGMLLTSGLALAASGADPDAKREVPEVEIPSLRTANSKTYRLSDGTYRYVAYAEDIHYRGTDGLLKDIDNSISAASKSGYRYSNTANAWKSYFADTLSANRAVTLEKDGYLLHFSMPQAASKATVQKSDAMKASAQAYYKELRADNRSVIFEEVQPGVDVAYTVRTNSLKEDIILKSAAAPNTFQFDLCTEGKPLTADDAGGTIAFRNSAGEAVFVLAPLYMEDANGKYSEAVSYTLKKSATSYQITLTADKDFLQAPDTQYPVVIDPSVMITGSDDTKDTYIDEQYPDSNYNTAENFWTGGTAGSNIMRAYIRFDLTGSTVPPVAQVTAAYLRLQRNSSGDGVVPKKVIANRATADWYSATKIGTVTWENRDQFPYTTEGATGQQVFDTGSWYKIDATEMVKSWLNGTNPNHGFVLKEADEASKTQKTRWFSSDAAAGKRPELVIEYSTTPVTPAPTATPVGATPTPTPGGTCNCIVGDVNGDGIVSALDAALILRYLAGLYDLVTPVYNKGDVAVINWMIDYNAWHLPKAPADGSSIPPEWDQLGAGQTTRYMIWTDTAKDRRLIHLNCSDMGRTVTIWNKTKLKNTLDLRGLSELVYLNCSGNDIEALNVTGLSKLEEINCSRNTIDTLQGVSGLVNLIALNCSDNYLTSLSLCPTAKYIYLDVRYNKFPYPGIITGYNSALWDRENFYYTPQRP
ncbi:MAG: DNRLRE domain-containing protein [Clostridiales bacterium]|nr:DNRLRE domain-containing protein [Clostridiales bacterium]